MVEVVKGAARAGQRPHDEDSAACWKTRHGAEGGFRHQRPGPADTVCALTLRAWGVRMLYSRYSHSAVHLSQQAVWDPRPLPRLMASQQVSHRNSRASSPVELYRLLAVTLPCRLLPSKQTLIAMSEQQRRRLPAPPLPPSASSSRKRVREEFTLQQQQPSTWTPIGDDGTESSSAALASNKRRKSNMGRGIDLAVTTASTILHTAAEAVVVSARSVF